MFPLSRFFLDLYKPLSVLSPSLQVTSLAVSDAVNVGHFHDDVTDSALWYCLCGARFLRQAPPWRRWRPCPQSTGQLLSFRVLRPALRCMAVAAAPAPAEQQGTSFLVAVPAAVAAVAAVASALMGDLRGELTVVGDSWLCLVRVADLRVGQEEGGKEAWPAHE